MKVIDEKIAAGGKDLPPVHRTSPAGTKVVDIVAMLQESLKQRGGKKETIPRAKKKRKEAA
jgi:hypothetical protein